MKETESLARARALLRQRRKLRERPTGGESLTPLCRKRRSFWEKIAQPRAWSSQQDTDRSLRKGRLVSGEARNREIRIGWENSTQHREKEHGEKEDRQGSGSKIERQRTRKSGRPIDYIKLREHRIYTGGEEKVK